MNRETLKETIRQELPELLRLDPDFRSCILEITRDTYIERKEAQNWFYEMLDEMRRERERQDKKWKERLQEQKEHQSKEMLNGPTGRNSGRRMSGNIKRNSTEFTKKSWPSPKGMTDPSALWGQMGNAV